MRMTLGPVGALARIHLGLRGAFSVGSTFTGIRATLSAPRSGTPVSTFFGGVFLGGVFDEVVTVNTG